MRLFILSAAIGATLLGALPASADVVIRSGDNGVVVREHDGDRDRDSYRHGNDWKRHHAECRTVKVRKTLPNGKVIIKTRQVC